MIGRMCRGPNANRRHSGTLVTASGEGKNSRNVRSLGITVASPRDGITHTRHRGSGSTEGERSDVALVLVGNTSAKSEVSVELNSRRDACLRVLVQLPRNNIGSAHFILLTTTSTLHPSYLDPPHMPETRDSYSLAQIPVCTTLWYKPVHTIPRFSVYLFVPYCGTN